MIKDEFVDGLKHCKEQCEQVRADIVEMQRRLEVSGQNSSDLLITSKQLVSLLKDVLYTLKNSKTKTRAFSYVFTESELCRNLLSSTGLGYVEACSTEKQSRTRVRTSLFKHLSLPQAVDVKTPQDKNDCWITGIALQPPGILLLVDCSNHCIKSADRSTYNILYYLPLMSGPWDITTLGFNEAAVTLPDQQIIQIISTIGGLFPVRNFKVNGQCRGIDSARNTIFVSYVDPGK